MVMEPAQYAGLLRQGNNLPPGHRRASIPNYGGFGEVLMRDPISKGESFRLKEKLRAGLLKSKLDAPLAS